MEVAQEFIHELSGDNSSFLVSNRDLVDQMISYLNTNFPSTLPTDSPRSLGIRSGYKGARLCHPHSQQYQYCLQTLILWKEIQSDMLMLWCLAEDDLLASNNKYSLRDTGQGPGSSQLLAGLFTTETGTESASLEDL